MEVECFPVREGAVLAATIPLVGADLMNDEHDLLMERLQEELAKCVALQLDATMMAHFMVMPIIGGGMCNPDVDAVAKECRRNFKVLKGGLGK
jgi:hypothetical protein